MNKHLCDLTGWDAQKHEVYEYRCSRCTTCYPCEHFFFEKAGRHFVQCPDKHIRPAGYDRKLFVAMFPKPLELGHADA